MLLCAEHRVPRPQMTYITNLPLTHERCGFVWADRLPTDVVFVGFTKPLDRVLHSRLLEVLRALCVTGLLLHWIKSFLIGNTTSARVL